MAPHWIRNTELDAVRSGIRTTSIPILSGTQGRRADFRILNETYSACAVQVMKGQIDPDIQIRLSKYCCALYAAVAPSPTAVEI